MPDRIVVCNTSPLYYLHLVDHLDLLPRLYGAVLVPKAVVKELAAGAEGGVDTPDVSRLDWVQVVQVPQERLQVKGNLGAGEREVIALAHTHKRSMVIIDDRSARHAAKARGLACTGTLGVLVKAKERGYLTVLASVLERLRQTNMRLDEALLHKVLLKAGED